MTREEEIKDYAKHAMTAILSNDLIYGAIISNRKEDIKSKDCNLEIISADVATFARLFALALYTEVNK